MKHVIAVGMMVALFCGLAWSTPSQARLVEVSAEASRAQGYPASRAQADSSLGVATAV